MRILKDGGEQLIMLARDGKLEARGPRWRWERLTKTHWVAYPDRSIAVADLDDDHLRGVLAYLSRWDATTVLTRGLCHEMSREDDGGYEDGIPSAREQMERMIPCLVALEAEAQRRGIEVPKIPGFEHPEPSQ